MRARLAFAALPLLLSSCAAPYFVGQSGRTTPRGDFRVQAGAGVGVSTSALELIEDAQRLADNLQDRTCPDGTGTCWDSADLEPLADAVWQLALASPVQQHWELSARYGLPGGFDLGGHLGSGSWRLDGGWQLFGPRDASQPGWAGSVFLGWNHHKSNFASSLVEKFKGETGRNDFDLVGVTGRQYGRWAHLWLGGRYMLSSWKFEAIPSVPIIYDNAEVQQRLLGTDTKGTVHQAGGFLGGALGWHDVFAGLELNVVHYRGSARVLFQDRELSGVAVFPAFFVWFQH
jgi:hypothetical protein